jgi:hypothetical protein
MEQLQVQQRENTLRKLRFQHLVTGRSALTGADFRESSICSGTRSLLLRRSNSGKGGGEPVALLSQPVLLQRGCRMIARDRESWV